MSVSPRGKSVSFQGVTRHFGAVQAVTDVSLTVGEGEFVSLLGPSGSGKTTLLMMLAGFEQPSTGRILIGDKDVTGVAPNRRNIGMVFQKYALFPHMSVAKNIAFPLRMRRISKAERNTKIRHALEMVQLAGYEERKPGQLSGGQQQRVALARAIVFDPTVILMDEPLGALDRQLRQHMQVEIKQLQTRLGATVIYVTHDQEEALTMADRVAILNQGRIIQLGRPQELYHNPISTFVAGFLGEMNFFPVEVVDVRNAKCRVKIGGTVLEGIVAGTSPIVPGSAACLAVRPESVVVSPISSTNGPHLVGDVKHVVFNGASLMVLLDVSSGRSSDETIPVRVQVSGRSELAKLSSGDPVALSWSAPDAKIFSAPT